MAIQFMTGFDYYNQTQTGRVWTLAQGGNSLAPGRFGGLGWVFNNENGYLAQLIPSASTTVVGFAIAAMYGDSTNPILVLQDATLSRTSPITQLDFRLTSDGAIQVTRNGTILASTPSYTFTFSTLTTVSWNYIEIKSFINSSTGYVIIKFSGQTFLTSTLLNTQYSGNNFVNMVRFQPFEGYGGTGQNQYQIKFDDIYVLDDTGLAPQNDFLGECRIQTQFPTANGETNNFSVIGATNNWQAVDETISDDDATFVRSGVVGSIDDYIMGSIALTGTIYGVQLNLTERKDDVGTRTITPIIKSGGSFYTGSLFPCQSSYTIAQKLWQVEPQANAPWTNASVNAITAGIKIVA
jgi:hypothetical protein